MRLVPSQFEPKFYDQLVDQDHLVSLWSRLVSRVIRALEVDEPDFIVWAFDTVPSLNIAVYHAGLVKLPVQIAYLITSKVSN